MMPNVVAKALLVKCDIPEKEHIIKKVQSLVHFESKYCTNAQKVGFHFAHARDIV